MKRFLKKLLLPDADVLELKGEVFGKVKTKEGGIKNYGRLSGGVITNGSLLEILKMMNSKGSMAPSVVGVYCQLCYDDPPAPESPNDTTVGKNVLPNTPFTTAGYIADTTTQTYKVIVEYDISFSSSYTLTCAGFFWIGTTAGPTLFDRAVFNTPIVVNNGDLLQLTYTLTITR